MKVSRSQLFSTILFLFIAISIKLELMILRHGLHKDIAPSTAPSIAAGCCAKTRC